MMSLVKPKPIDRLQAEGVIIIVDVELRTVTIAAVIIVVTVGEQPDSIAPKSSKTSEGPADLRNSDCARFNYCLGVSSSSGFTAELVT